MADLQEILQLLIDQNNGTISKQGQQELDAWANESPWNKAFIEQEFSPELLRERMAELSKRRAEENKKHLWDLIQQQGPRQFRVMEMGDEPLAKPLWSKLLIAASLLIVAVAVYFLINRHNDNSQVAGNKKVERARIVDNKGRIFYLDSVKFEGPIARIGKLKIEKRDEWHIACTFTDAPAFMEVDDLITIFIPHDKDTGWQISFPDGTRALVYSGNLSVPILKNSEAPLSYRDVTFQGIGMFDVTPNANVPFQISSPEGDKIAVLGTFFGINSDNKTMKDSVSLYNGGALKIMTKNDTIQIRPGQLALIDKTSSNIDTTQLLKNQERIPWRRDMFNFSEQNLPAAMERVRKWYKMKGVKFGPGVDTVTLGRFSGGQISKDLELDPMLKMVEENTTNMHFKIKDSVIYVNTR